MQAWLSVDELVVAAAQGRQREEAQALLHARAALSLQASMRCASYTHTHTLDGLLRPRRVEQGAEAEQTRRLAWQ